MKGMMDKRQADELNWFVAHHWHDGLNLSAYGVNMGDVITYNLLQVMGNHWLAYEAHLKAEAAKPELDPGLAQEFAALDAASDADFGATMAAIETAAVTGEILAGVRASAAELTEKETGDQ